MFIKLLTPNRNGKVEFTIAELEAFISEAVNKAISEQCGRCYKNGYGYWYNNYSGLANSVSSLDNRIKDVNCSYDNTIDVALSTYWTEETSEYLVFELNGGNN
jgi:hypothetical protein